MMLSDQGTTLYSGESITSFKLGASNTLLTGVDDYTLSSGEAKDGIDRFKDTETVDLNLFICGKANATEGHLKCNGYVY